MNVDITKNNQTGNIDYDIDTKRFIINFPDKKIVKEIKNYLLSKKIIEIPKSEDLDDYTMLRNKSIINDDFFNLFLSTIYSDLGIEVIWT